ncbi:MAG: C39 family peptidase [Anaerolineae bacterium]|nr:C39 family peptidase [Anaerolineae bacterium]
MNHRSEARTRDMLMSSEAPARRRRVGRLDTLSVAYIALLAVSLIALGLATWLGFVAPRQRQLVARSTRQAEALHRAQQTEGTPDAQQGENARSLWGAVHAEQTRRAQAIEIARLESELAVARRVLATATAVAAQPTATPVGAGASTVIGAPPLALILDAPVHKQAHRLGCESSAAAMAANYFGVDLSEEAILAALPRHDNPHLGFRGEIDGPYGGIEDYGVYAEPIREVLLQHGLQVEPLNGGIDAIREHLRRERLVLAWITYDLQVQTPVQVETSDGQTVTLIPYEHVVLVSGYNANGLWANEPYKGTQEFYLGAEFERSFAYLGNMALVVGLPGDE